MNISLPLPGPMALPQHLLLPQHVLLPLEMYSSFFLVKGAIYLSPKEPSLPSYHISPLPYPCGSYNFIKEVTMSTFLKMELKEIGL